MGLREGFCGFTRNLGVDLLAAIDDSQKSGVDLRGANVALRETSV